MKIIVIINKAILGIFNVERPNRFRYTIIIGDPQQPKKKQENHKTTANKPLPKPAFSAFFLLSLYFKKANTMKVTDRA